MFAVIRSGGKQHRVAENDRMVVERLNAEPGDLVAFDKVLMIAEDGQEPLVGSAVPVGARVFGQVLEQTRGPKLIVFKKKRRKNHRRTKGHRQDLTAVRIASISLTGEAAAAEVAERVAEVEPQAEVVADPEAASVREPEPALQE
jgi:large subunit ribosomal protein L21